MAAYCWMASLMIIILSAVNEHLVIPGMYIYIYIYIYMIYTMRTTAHFVRFELSDVCVWLVQAWVYATLSGLIGEMPAINNRSIYHSLVWRCYVPSYRGKISIKYPAQGNRYDTPPHSERRDIWSVGTVYGRTLTYQLRFNTWRARNNKFSGCALEGFDNFVSRSEIRPRALDKVKCECVTYFWTTCDTSQVLMG